MANDYNRLQKFSHRIASTSWASLLNARVFPHLDRLVFKLSRKRYTALSMMSGLPLVMVHTIGAKSGIQRTIPLMCIRIHHSDLEFAIIASNWGKHHLPAWYYNLKANPQVDCTIRGETRPYLASEATGEDYRSYWQMATQIYVGYSQYKRRAGRHIPIIIMTPVRV